MRDRLTLLATLAVLALLLAGTILSLATVVGPVLAVVVATLALAVLAGGALYRSGSGSVWDAIPGEQYGGRHAESGGISRGEQERAIEDVKDQAKDLENQH